MNCRSCYAIYTRKPLLVLMYWDHCCLIHWTLKMSDYLLNESLYSYIAEMPLRIFTIGHTSVSPNTGVVLQCSVQTTGGWTLPTSSLLEGLTICSSYTGQPTVIVCVFIEINTHTITVGWQNIGEYLSRVAIGHSYTIL